MSYWDGKKTDEEFKVAPQFEPPTGVRYRQYETERPHGYVQGDAQFDPSKKRKAYAPLTQDSSYLARQTARERRKAQRTMATKRAINEVLSDPDFDSSLAGSRLRLEQALAIGTELALRTIMDGKFPEEDAERLGKLASTYARIASTLPTTDPKELDPETLEKIAGT